MYDDNNDNERGEKKEKQTARLNGKKEIYLKKQKNEEKTKHMCARRSIRGRS